MRGFLFEMIGPGRDVCEFIDDFCDGQRVVCRRVKTLKRIPNAQTILDRECGHRELLRSFKQRLMSTDEATSEDK